MGEYDFDPLCQEEGEVNVDGFFHSGLFGVIFMCLLAQINAPLCCYLSSDS